MLASVVMTDEAVYVQRVQVSFEYPVHFTRAALEPDNPALLDAVARHEPTRRHRIFAVIDAGVAACWPELSARLTRYCEAHAASLSLAAAPLVIPGGEAAKQSPALIDDLHARMHALGIDRHSCVLIIGGGAVLDAVGYAAATTHRGVRVVRMPTTVLAQNDAGIGVKNGINAFGTKNCLGTFAAPFAVVNDAELLQTLPARDRRAGMAEAVKVALIRDPAFFTWLCEHAQALAGFEPRAIEHSIRRAAELHLRHIAQGGDPFELGSARPLDYGHWAAHKLESLTDHRLRHGEAVAIGMAIDTRYAVETGLCAAADGAAVITLLEALGFCLWDDALAQHDANGRPAVLSGLADFREHLGGELNVTLLQGIGRTLEVHALDETALLRAIAWLQAHTQHNAERRGHAASSCC
jgi:3-dehydroquinate synthase